MVLYFIKEIDVMPHYCQKYTLAFYLFII